MIKRIFLTKISEFLVILFMAIGFVGFYMVGTAAETHLMLSVFVPKEPKIDSITIYPNINAVSFNGQMGYAEKITWLDDQESGEIIQFLTNEDSKFTAALSSTSLMLQPGLHKVVAYLNLMGKDKKEGLIKSNVVGYLIDENSKLILDPQSSKDVVISTQDISLGEFRSLQQKFQVSIVRPSQSAQVNYWLEGYQEAYVWFIVWEWSVVFIYLVSVCVLIYQRWRRKKRQGQSFWSIGKGVYLDLGHNQNSSNR